MNRRLRLAGFLVLLAGVAVSAGQAPQTPTFRGGVEYVEVDVIVTNAQGDFVRGLKKEDFQITEDGKAQTVSDFTMIDIPIERYDRPLYATQPIEPDVRSNARPFDGRVYVMVIDDLHTNFGRTQRTKAAARQFIEQRLGANDLMAVLHTSGPDTANQEFTNSKRLLLAAVDQTLGRGLQSSTVNRIEQYNRSLSDSANDPEDQERAMNAESSLRVLKDVADWFATVRGRRKAILFISEGIDYDITQVVPGGPNSINNVAPGAAWASGVIDATRDTVQAAMRSNVSIFGIDPRGLTNLGDDDIKVQEYPQDQSLGISVSSLRNEVQMSQDSLRTLSDETGGFAIVGRNDLRQGFDRIVADNSSYYVLAYYPPSDKRDGKFHKINVRVNRPGVTVRARRGYLSPKGKAPAAPAVSDKGPSLALREALNSPLPVTGVTMNVSLAPFKGTSANASVLLTAEVRGADVNLTPNNTLEISYLAVDPRGKIRGGNNDQLKMVNLRPETKARIEQSGFRMLNRMELPPGRYQVRIATHDQANGTVGSITYDLEVPDFYKLPFSMSGLVMTSLSTSAMVTAKPDEQLKTTLPAPPVAQRTFPQNDEIALFAEVYDNSGAAAHKVDIVTTVTSDDGKVLFKAEEERASSEIQGGRGGYGYVARVPLNDIAPGDYVLTVEARSRLGDTPVVRRQVQIRVAPPSAAPSR